MVVDKRIVVELAENTGIVVVVVVADNLVLQPAVAVVVATVEVVALVIELVGSIKGNKKT